MTDSWNAEYLNNREQCIICFQPPKCERAVSAENNDPYSKPQSSLVKRKISDKGGTLITIPLIKHHVTYFPEKIAFVHYECHKKIHGDPPITIWIQYYDGDARKFYTIKQEKENGQVDTKDKA